MELSRTKLTFFFYFYVLHNEKISVTVWNRDAIPKVKRIRSKTKTARMIRIEIIIQNFNSNPLILRSLWEEIFHKNDESNFWKSSQKERMVVVRTNPAMKSVSGDLKPNNIHWIVSIEYCNLITFLHPIVSHPKFIQLTKYFYQNCISEFVIVMIPFYLLLLIMNTRYHVN